MSGPPHALTSRYPWSPSWMVPAAQALLKASHQQSASPQASHGNDHGRIVLHGLQVRSSEGPRNLCSRQPICNASRAQADLGTNCRAIFASSVSYL